MSEKQINEIFDRPVFNEQDIRFHNEKYEEVKLLAKEIDICLPDSAEKTLVFRALQTALMHLGKAIGLRNASTPLI